MLLACLLVITLVLLFAFSMSGETGKNTKFARKDANDITQKQETEPSIDDPQVIKIN